MKYAYSVNCTWHGPLTEVGRKTHIPGCPYCGSPLLLMDNRETWQSMVNEYEGRNHANYSGFVLWLRTVGKCWKNYGQAAIIYKEKTGLAVAL
jgi:hypothetical protein